MSSTQSQEEIASIHRELSSILQRDRKQKSSNNRNGEGKEEEEKLSSQESQGSREEEEEDQEIDDGGNDTQTESEIEEEQSSQESGIKVTKSRSPRRNLRSQQLTGRKRDFENRTSDDEGQPDEDEAAASSPSKSQKPNPRTGSSLAAKDIKGSPKSAGQSVKPIMQRTQSLESIAKNPPAKVIKVCMEKATQLLQGNEARDYKKLKYWLKVAQTVSLSIEREIEFNDFIKNLRQTYPNDKDLKTLLDTTFPSTIMDASN